MKATFTNVEKEFFNKSHLNKPKTKIPYIQVDNIPNLGLLTSLRFLEWTLENPQGVISLPTGKTPEYFIKWTQHILSNWNDPKVERLCKDNGLNTSKKPDLGHLKFVQIDEFYPINPLQHNSFYYFVQKFYIKGFGLNPKNSLLINSSKIPDLKGIKIENIFPNYKIDLSLRYRDTNSDIEEKQKQTIFSIDQWCSEYENKIADLGGIGFFLGGIGPDGHIAFNVRGSDHNSTTRILETNFETQAISASDLGGIEISRNRLVITIGLSTITKNPNVIAIIFAAGRSKAKIVKDSLQKRKDIKFPATALIDSIGSRFYLTKGAAYLLDEININKKDWNAEETNRALVKLCKSLNKFGIRLTKKDIIDNQITSSIPNINENTSTLFLKQMKKKIQKASDLPTNNTILHTGPHHDDILLGYSPIINHLVRSPKNINYFAVMTSGFTSVTNGYIANLLSKTLELVKLEKIQMIKYPDFFDRGFKLKKAKDVYHYLDKVASQNTSGQIRGLCHRMVRSLVDIYSLKSLDELIIKIKEIIEYLSNCYDGEKNPPDIQKLKGMLREFEEELAWAHYGVDIKNIYHLRLGFYKGDIFTETPNRERDIEPIIKLINQTNPDIITLALDPEGSGPDTHYKVLQSIAEALRILSKEKDISKVKIWGYRNVWYRFDSAEADIMFPVSLNSMAVVRDTFLNCYLSQKDASFPSYELDGPFCDLTQKIWVKQHRTMELILGKDFWYQNKDPHFRATHGLVYLKELTVEEFLNTARVLEESIEGSIIS
jgi:glucosamine-6-phosphate deaminase